MYDDLERSQRPSHLEWLVVNLVIPSLLVTFVLHARADASGERAPTHDLIVCILPVVGIDHPLSGPIPDLFPVLLTMPEPEHPIGMGTVGSRARVFLRALVDPRGRISPSSIVVVQSPDERLDVPARQALAAALFRPARFDGQPIAAWITIAVNFNVREE